MRTVAGGDVEPNALVRALDTARCRLDEDANSVLLEARPEQRSGIGIETRQQVAVVLDDRDVGAHAPEELRQLDTDGSAAEHEEAAGDRARPDRFAIRPVLDLREAFERWQRRAGSGGDDELVVLELPFADRDDPGSRDARFAPDELGALLRQPIGVPRVVAAIRDLIAPPEDTLDVDVARDRLGRSGSDARGCQRLGRP